MEAALGLIGQFVGNSSRRRAERQARADAEKAQQRQLATVAAENARLDQEKAVATPGNARGRRLLTYALQDQSGAATLGG